MKLLKGLRFNSLTVTDFCHVDTRGKAIWKCHCDCGKMTFADTSSLISGNKKSCGHLKKDYRLSLKKKFRSALGKDISDADGWNLDEGLEDIGAY